MTTKFSRFIHKPRNIYSMKLNLENWYNGYDAFNGIVDNFGFFEGQPCPDVNCHEMSDL